MTVTTERGVGPRTKVISSRVRAAGVLRQTMVLMVVPICVLLGWAVLATLVDSMVFPGPIQAVEGLIEDLQRPEYRHSVLTSVRLLAISWAVSYTHLTLPTIYSV